jgi:hypothetical protein
LGTVKASALGRTKADGPVTAAKMMIILMDGGAGILTQIKNFIILAKISRLMSLPVKFMKLTASTAVNFSEVEKLRLKASRPCVEIYLHVLKT